MLTHIRCFGVSHLSICLKLDCGFILYGFTGTIYLINVLAYFHLLSSIKYGLVLFVL